MKQCAVTPVRVVCDNCLDSHQMVVVAYEDGEARIFDSEGSRNPNVATRRIEKSHKRRGYDVVEAEQTIDVDVNFVAMECSTCHWQEKVVVLVDRVSLDHVVAA